MTLIIARLATSILLGYEVPSSHSGAHTVAMTNGANPILRARSTLRPALHLACVICAVAFSPTTSYADELFVGPSDAFTTIGDALSAAVDGDVVTVRAGTYAEAVATSAAGVTLRAEAGGGEVLITTNGRVLDVSHDGFTVEGVVVDGQFGDRDAVRVQADDFTMRDVEVRNTARDCVDLGDVSGVLIEGSRIHHCLNSTSPNCSDASCRSDGHAIVGGAVRDLTIRDSELYAFSGDGFQADPSRGDAGWDNVRIVGCHIWLAPLAEAVGGFAAGVVPGENAVDTKTSDTRAEPGRLTIEDTFVSGFRGGLISNMAAFNLKENVEAHVSRVTVSDSEIAFRLRGATGSRPRGAAVTVDNTVVFDVDTAVRYEDGLDRIVLSASTFGGAIGRLFQDVSRDGPSTIEAQNVLALASSLPAELSGGSNLATGASGFVDAAGHDYHLIAGADAIDTGIALPALLVDRDGTARPAGAGYDVGAYEYCASACSPVDGGVPMPDAGRADGGVMDSGATDGSPGDGGPGDGGGASDSGDAMTLDGGGCGCRVGSTQGAAQPIGLAALALLLWSRRRKR